MPQYKKFQTFEHTQKWCAKDLRNIKCAGKHWTIRCEKRKCVVNCGEEHPTNDRGCIVAKELQEI